MWYAFKNGNGKIRIAVDADDEDAAQERADMGDFPGVKIETDEGGWIRDEDNDEE